MARLLARADHSFPDAGAPPCRRDVIHITAVPKDDAERVAVAIRSGSATSPDPGSVFGADFAEALAPVVAELAGH